VWPWCSGFTSSPGSSLGSQWDAPVSARGGYFNGLCFSAGFISAALVSKALSAE